MLPDYLIECPNIEIRRKKNEQFYCMDWWKEVA